MSSFKEMEIKATVALDGDTRRACNNENCSKDYGHKDGCSDEPTITDGFGSEWPLRCEEDGCDGINQVMRPGSAQCSKEHLHGGASQKDRA